MVGEGRPGISTHVLDTERGEPARGVPVTLYRSEERGESVAGRGTTDDDGRVREMAPDALRVGAYRLCFDIATWALHSGRERPFFTELSVSVIISDPDRNYHVPLLLSPFSMTTYRGT